MIKFIKFVFWLYFTKEGIKQRKVYEKQDNCKHEKWNCDNQIRTIECISCGKRAWIDDYVNLYK